MPSFAGLSKFFGNTASNAAGFAAGLAIGPALHPVIQDVVNESWSLHQSRVLDAGTAAAIVAEDVEQTAWGENEAKQTGISAERFDAMVKEQLNAPGVPQLLTLWRRGDIDDGTFLHGLRKAKLEGRWDTPLQALKTDRLDPAIIAAGIVRGLVADPGILPVGPPTSAGKVPAFPQFNVDALTEAAASGIDKERLSVMVGNYGRPANPTQAAHAEWRGAIDHVDYLRAISEGDVRNEWAEAIYEASREILTAGQYVEANIRGQATADERRVGTRKHGMSDADSDLLYEIGGRGLVPHAITTGLARGGKFPGKYANVPEPYKSAIERALTREEFAELAYANRYNYPSAFVLRSMAQAGELGDTAAVEQILLELGWKPSFASLVATAWTTAGPSADKNVSSAETKFVTAIHRRYTKGEVSHTEAAAALAETSMTSDVQAQVLAIFAKERAFLAVPATTVA